MSTAPADQRAPTHPGTVLAVDMGGTHLRHTVAADDPAAGPTLAVSREPSETADPAAQLRRLVRAAHREHGPLRHVVIGLPGVIHDGQLSDAPNLAQLQGPAALEQLRRELPCPVTFMNDCNLAALSEAADDVAFVAIGTGLGCGLVRGGRVMTGAHGQAGEFGLLPLPDGGVLEDLLSGPGLRRRHVTYGGAGDPLGDPGAPGERVRQDARTALAYLLRALTCSVDPQAIVFGGGVGLHLGELIDAAWRDVRGHLRHVPRPTVSRHGDAAALVGGLRVARGAAEVIHGSR